MEPRHESELPAGAMLLSALGMELWPETADSRTRRNRLRSRMNHRGITAHGPVLTQSGHAEKWVTAEDATRLRTAAATGRPTLD